MQLFPATTVDEAGLACALVCVSVSVSVFVCMWRWRWWWYNWPANGATGNQSKLASHQLAPALQKPADVIVIVTPIVDYGFHHHYYCHRDDDDDAYDDDYFSCATLSMLLPSIKARCDFVCVCVCVCKQVRAHNLKQPARVSKRTTSFDAAGGVVRRSS